MCLGERGGEGLISGFAAIWKAGHSFGTVIMKRTMVIFLAAALPAMAAGPEWLTSLPAAKTKAQAEHKLILLDFTGSDWCIPCQKMAADVFAKPEFERYASSNYVLVEVDDP